MSKWKFIKENYIPIKNFENLYGIDTQGNIFGFKRKKIVKQKTNMFGYSTIKLCKENKLYYFMVHRLVAQTFIPNPNNLPQVNHKDGNKQNNNVNNLEWCTRSYNMKHAYKTGLEKPKGKKVYQWDNNHNLIKIYNSIRDANISMGLSKNSKVIKTRCDNQKDYKGFLWSFDKEVDL